MDGLYALKPWYAARLTPLRERLVAAKVSPSAVSVAGVAFAAGAAAALVTLPTGLLSGCAVAALLAARLACANLDGGIARTRGRSTPHGAVVNELSDRAADLIVIAACAAVAPVALVIAAAFCASMPSLVSMVGVSAGLPRRQGGPVGKTERAALVVVIAALGGAVPVLLTIAVGSLGTAAVRLVWVRRELAGGAR
ncbi:MAG: CDP-diacylglycerol---glycerol-3-phosphate 3-phosphatidyltransferase [Frankiaceae bacterium]|nr:CDP-diacylglycerol---glycerol-3-phosphate 3-phosphatidyltransferase [Frankiaceae bacterium]